MIIFNCVLVSVLMFVYPGKSSTFPVFKHLFISDFLKGRRVVLLPLSTFVAATALMKDLNSSFSGDGTASNRHELSSQTSATKKHVLEISNSTEESFFVG